MTDICMNRHKNNPQSLAANKRVNREHDRKRILEFLAQRGRSYSKQIAEALGKPLHTISGRLSELKEEQIIEETGNKLEGCAELKLVNQQLTFF